MKTLRRITALAVTGLLALWLNHIPASADEPQAPRYELPPQVMVDLVDAPETPDVIPSPDRTTLLILQREGLPSIAELSQPELRLAGPRMDPLRYGPSRVSHFRRPSLDAPQEKR